MRFWCQLCAQTSPCIQSQIGRHIGRLSEDKRGIRGGGGFEITAEADDAKLGTFLSLCPSREIYCHGNCLRTPHNMHVYKEGQPR
jgi:hypothetical protein